MQLNEWGEIVRIEWLKSSELRKEIELDEFVIMPNHFHGILLIHSTDTAYLRRGTARRAPTTGRFGKPLSRTLPTIIRAFKSAVTKRINALRNMPGAPVWQRNYWERVIRNESELMRVREYVVNNPVKWEWDRENPAFEIRPAKSGQPAEPWTES